MSLATATLCALSTSSAAHAAGGAAHVVAGQLARDQLQDAELKALLKKHEGAYLHGTLYPDAILQLLQLAEKTGGQQGQYTSDDWSHGIKQSAAESPKGMMAHYWREFWKKCPDGATTDECGVALAFFMGIVTHLVTDGPWHNEFIDRSADLCEAPLTPLDGNGWAHPGGPGVAREASGEVKGWGRHRVADKDFDGCLSAALRGSPSLLGDVKGVIPGNPQIYAPAKFLRKVAALKTAKAKFRRDLALTCAENQFANAGDTNNCYSCPSGFTHDALKRVEETGVCTRKSNVTGTYRGKASFSWPPCPSGQWLGGDSCYTCDQGYSHNSALTAGTPGVCYLDDNRTATFEKKLNKECPAGEFPNAEFSGCYACPAGYEHNPTLAVGQDGVCIEARVNMCDSGFYDPRLGGECWSCPAGYSRTVVPAVAVNTGQACARPGILACKDVTPPASNPRVTPGALPKSMLPFTLLKSAYDADGLTTWKLFEADFSMLDWTDAAKKALPKSKITPMKVKVEGGFPAQGHKDLMDYYPRIFAQRDLVAPELTALPESAVCSKMIAGAITRKGGLNDSAAASARFMEAIWKERQSKAAATVIRVDNFEYVVVKDKQVLHRSTARSCETSRECGTTYGPTMCVDGECHRSDMKAPEAPADSLYYMFVNKASGLCLDPKGYDGAAGRNVGMFRCEGRFDQVFQMTRRSSGVYGRLITANGNACLDVKGYDGAADKNVGLYACEDLDDQAWNIADAGDTRWRSSEDGATGWVQVKNLMKGTCLASEGNAESDANVRVEACVPDKATQLWVPIEVNTRGQASHVLVHKGLGGCLDPDGADAASTHDVAIRRCSGSEDQLFFFGEGDAIARNQRSNICLDVAGYDGAVGGTIGLYTCDGGADQKWSVAPKTSGWKQVKNPKASTCLDVAKTDVQLGKCDAGLASQQWATVPIPTWPTG